jgi:ankyrin repeat protein
MLMMDDLDSQVGQRLSDEASLPSIDWSNLIDFDMSSAQDLDGHNTPTLTCEMPDQEACSELARILALKAKPGDSGYVQDVISYLEPITLDRTDGKLTQDMVNLLAPHQAGTLLQHLSYSVYLASDNLLSQVQIKNLYNLMVQNKYHWILGTLAEIDLPITRIFLANIFLCVIISEDVDIIQVMISKGADVDAPAQAGSKEDRETPLQAAVSTGNIQLVDLLLRAGADPDYSATLCTDVPLQLAVEAKNYRLTELLLSTGANPNGGLMGNPLQFAAGHSQHEIARLLLENGADVNFIDSPMRGTALQVAIANCDIEMVRLLLSWKVDVNVPTLENWVIRKVSPWLKSPVHTAVVLNNFELVQILLDAKADVNFCQFMPLLEDYEPAEEDNPLGIDIRDEDHWTPLQVAVINRNHQLVQLLLNALAAVDDRGADQRQRTPLRMALEAGDANLVRMLLRHHADINATDDRVDVNCTANAGKSPMQTAVASGNIELVKRLIDKGAGVNCTDNTGELPIQTAVASGNIKMVKVLIDEGVDVNAPAGGSLPRTAVQTAAAKGDLRIIQILLDAGADVNAPAAGVGGRTAYNQL